VNHGILIFTVHFYYRGGGMMGPSLFDQMQGMNMGGPMGGMGGPSSSSRGRSGSGSTGNFGSPDIKRSKQTGVNTRTRVDLIPQGQVVRIHGLRNQAEHNMKQAVVEPMEPLE